MSLRRAHHLQWPQQARAQNGNDDTHHDDADAVRYGDPSRTHEEVQAHC
jgi:hypothetical protein